MLKGHLSRCWRIGALAVLLAGCETAGNGMTMTSPRNESARLDVADAGFRLTAEQRASVEPGFDVDALERLLAVLHPDLRLPVLGDFQRDRLAPNEIGGGLMKFEDPVLQALLDEVWAPRWEGVPDDWLNNPEFRRFPGQDIAKQRRLERRGNNPRQP